MTEKLDPNGSALRRRELMGLLGAGFTWAGFSACTRAPREKIFPYVRRPPEVTPGEALQYATSMVIDGFAMGLLARSHEGRPTKIEGNPEHPASLGATGAYEQASVLELYDPRRLRSVRLEGAPASWEQALTTLQGSRSFRPWLVLPPQSSPVISRLLQRIRERYPAARICFHSPLARHKVYRATRLLFGRPLDQHPDFARARVTLSLGADFLNAMPMSVRWSRDFSSGRRGDSASHGLSRLYALETMLSPTGSVADHRLAVAPSALPRIAAALLRELATLNGSSVLPEAAIRALPRAEDFAHSAWIRAVARDLRESAGQSIVIAGDQASLETHVLAHALNAACRNVGHTITFKPPSLLEPEGGATLEELVLAIQSRSVDAVLILDCNPVYTAGPELDLGHWLGQVPNTIHLSCFENETSRACKWLLPLSHYLETWGDARSYDGTISMIQPLIEPLYRSKSAFEVLAACAGVGAADGHALLTQHWRTELGPSFDRRWPELLRLGFIQDSTSLPITPEADFGSTAAVLSSVSQAGPSQVLELNFEPSPVVYDGRFASNAWLLELPHPLTKLTWGNAAILSPATARTLELQLGQVVSLETRNEKIDAPVLVLPGHADGAITLELGYGQSGAMLGQGIGVNAYALRGESGAFARVRVHNTGAFERLAITQDHSETRGRPLALSITHSQYSKHPDFAEHLRGPQPSLLPLYPRTNQGPGPGLSWAMTIDTTICTGCSACVIACQAENNVPAVGKAEVERGREMHWLRIDRYFEGPPEQPLVVHQPMLCQHCEKAPCEYVCPVNATVHSPDGLNEMVYNRCIGTRFCSNNCPYKVRRFNWFDYTEHDTSTRLQRNPDVTVRERGVMEKCTYCVQRIRRAEMQARIEKRATAPGEVVTACQQACPTGAIQFGALEHRNTKMVQWREDKRTYAALHDLGTRPRTQYLARLVNTNPELDP